MSSSYRLVSVNDGLVSSSKAGGLDLDTLELDLASTVKASSLPVGTRQKHVLCSQVSQISLYDNFLEIEGDRIPNYEALDCVYFVEVFNFSPSMCSA